MIRILERYPAAILGIISAVLQLLVAYGMDLSSTEIGAINAAVAAVLGVATALLIARERLLPAILGLGQAAVNVLIAFGVISAHQAPAWMAILAAAAAAFAHTQVHASIDAAGRRVRRQSIFRLAA